MRRWLSLLLLVLLPLQFTWAAAAVYCQHEAAPAARHVGHHEHEHEDAVQAKKDTRDAVKLAKFTSDNDCGSCHLTALKPLQAEPLAVPALNGRQAPAGTVHPLQTREPDRLERPNWGLA